MTVFRLRCEWGDWQYEDVPEHAGSHTEHWFDEEGVEVWICDEHAS